MIPAGARISICLPCRRVTASAGTVDRSRTLTMETRPRRGVRYARSAAEVTGAAAAAAEVCAPSPHAAATEMPAAHAVRCAATAWMPSATRMSSAAPSRCRNSGPGESGKHSYGDEQFGF